MSDTNPLFEGFKPQGLDGPALPAEQPETDKQKKARLKKEAGTAKKAAAQAAPAKPKSPKPPRKPRAAKVIRSTGSMMLPQYNLQVILKAMRALHEEDYALFDKLLAASEASRKRIVAALAKIFL